jgi:hypothetical protein
VAVLVHSASTVPIDRGTAAANPITFTMSFPDYAASEIVIYTASILVSQLQSWEPAVRQQDYNTSMMSSGDWSVVLCDESRAPFVALQCTRVLCAGAMVSLASGAAAPDSPRQWHRPAHL